VISGAKQPLLSFVLAVPAERAFGRLDSTAFRRTISIEELWKEGLYQAYLVELCPVERSEAPVKKIEINETQEPVVQKSP